MYLKADSGLAIPYRDTAHNLWRNVHRPGLVTCRPADSLFYMWTGIKWSVMGADVASLISLINQKVDSVTVSGDSLWYWKLGVSYGYILPTAGWKLTGNVVTDANKFGATNSHRVPFITDNTERMVIDASGLVGIGNANPDKILDIVSTTGGVLISRMTTVQRDAITHTQTGELIYNTTTDKFNYYNGAAWVVLNVSGTETWQDVLTNGSTLTANNAPNFSGYSFSMTGDVGSKRIQLILGSDSTASLKLRNTSGGEIAQFALNGTDSSATIQSTSGKVKVKGLTNLSTQDRLIGQYDTNDQLGYVSVGSGLTLSGGVLSNSGVTSPAGNYGNVQLNRNGVFATPASDSLNWTGGDLENKGYYHGAGLTVNKAVDGVVSFVEASTSDYVSLRSATASGSNTQTLQARNGTIANIDQIPSVHPVGDSAWLKYGNSITAGASWLGTTNNARLNFITNNVNTMSLDSLGARLFLKNGLNPLLSFKQSTTNQEWQVRANSGDGASSTGFNIYDATNSKTRLRITASNNSPQLTFGNADESIPSETFFYIKGTSQHAGTLDVRSDSSTGVDFSTVEVEKSDYTNGEGAALGVYGNVGISGSVFGFPLKNLSEVRMRNTYNVFEVQGAHRLYIGNNDTARIILDSIGGKVRLPAYGSGLKTGTATYAANFDANGYLIEGTTPAVQGSGTLNYLSKWTPNGSTLGNSSVFDSLSRIGVGTTDVSDLSGAQFGGAGTQKPVGFFINNTASKIASVVIGGANGAAIQFVNSSRAPTADFGYALGDLYFVNRNSGNIYFGDASVAGRVTIGAGTGNTAITGTLGVTGTGTIAGTKINANNIQGGIAGTSSTFSIYNNQSSFATELQIHGSTETTYGSGVSIPSGYMAVNETLPTSTAYKFEVNGAANIISALTVGTTATVGTSVSTPSIITASGGLSIAPSNGVTTISGTTANPTAVLAVQNNTSTTGAYPVTASFFSPSSTSTGGSVIFFGKDATHYSSLTWENGGSATQGAYYQTYANSYPFEFQGSNNIFNPTTNTYFKISGTGIAAISSGGISIGNGTTNPAASSILDLTSTTKGLLIPRQTTAQRDAISSPATGLQLYNTDNKAPEWYNGYSWGNAGLQTQNSRVASNFSVTSSTTLTNVTGLTATVIAGKTYKFEARLYLTDGTGGVNFAIGGTATATDFKAWGGTYESMGGGTVTSVLTTSLGSDIGRTSVNDANFTMISGTITVNAGGTLTVQFAQDTSDGDPSIILKNSTFTVTEIL